MPFTLEDFKRQYIREGFAELPVEQQLEILKALPPERLLQALPEKVRRLANRPAKERPAPRKQRRKK
jgi:hypothetical protein